MNGSRLRKIFMCVLPVAAAIIAAMPGTVQIIQEGELVSVSYMLAVPVGIAGICAPIAVILNYITAALVFFGLFFPKRGVFRAALGFSFTSSLVAVLPMFMHNEHLKIIPHVMFPIVTLAEAIFLYFGIKQGTGAKKQGKRLETR